MVNLNFDENLSNLVVGSAETRLEKQVTVPASVVFGFLEICEAVNKKGSSKMTLRLPRWEVCVHLDVYSSWQK
jgi:hypothetical protein